MAFKKTLACALAGASMLAAAPAGAVNLLDDGGFEVFGPGGPTDVRYGNGDEIGEWDVFGTDPDNEVFLLKSTYSEGPLTFNPHSGNYALDITGAGNTGFDAGIEQTIATEVDGWYNLVFWLGNASSDTNPYMTIYLNPSTVASEPPPVPNFVAMNMDTTPNFVNWKRFSYNFQATSANTTIRFFNRTVGDNYAGLDDIVVQAVPEPGTWAMMLIGFGAVGYAFRRRPKYRLAQAV